MDAGDWSEGSETCMLDMIIYGIVLVLLESRVWTCD